MNSTSSRERPAVGNAKKSRAAKSCIGVALQAVNSRPAQPDVVLTASGDVLASGGGQPANPAQSSPMAYVRVSACVPNRDPASVSARRVENRPMLPAPMNRADETLRETAGSVAGLSRVRELNRTRHYGCGP